jgi:hypothetical protein
MEQLKAGVEERLQARLLKAASVVYLAVEKPVADQLSALLEEAAAALASRAVRAELPCGCLWSPIHGRILCAACQSPAPAASRGAAPHERCTWTIDVWDESSMHETSCGEAFTVIDCESLEKHGFKFCVYCGKPVEEVRIDRYADEDEESEAAAPPERPTPAAEGESKS